MHTHGYPPAQLVMRLGAGRFLRLPASPKRRPLSPMNRPEPQLPNEQFLCEQMPAAHGILDEIIEYKDACFLLSGILDFCTTWNNNQP
jgi:hypothetical protein